MLDVVFCHFLTLFLLLNLLSHELNQSPPMISVWYKFVMKYLPLARSLKHVSQLSPIKNVPFLSTFVFMGKRICERVEGKKEGHPCLQLLTYLRMIKIPSSTFVGLAKMAHSEQCAFLRCLLIDEKIDQFPIPKSYSIVACNITTTATRSVSDLIPY